MTERRRERVESLKIEASLSKTHCAPCLLGASLLIFRGRRDALRRSLSLPRSVPRERGSRVDVSDTRRSPAALLLFILRVFFSSLCLYSALFFVALSPSSSSSTELRSVWEIAPSRSLDS